MATIRTSIQMFNGMTPGLRSMTNALNTVISSFETMQRVSSNSIDTSSLQAARAELNRAEVAFNQIEGSIRQADEQQNRFNSNMSHGTGIAKGLRNMLVGIGGAMGIQKIVNISDEFSRSTARLNLMANGMENVAGIQEQIYQSAQRTRTSYLDTMDAVAKLGLRAGSAFKNSNETIAFVEQLNKQFKIAGASQQEISSATLQLTQALGSGVLRGEEFNAVFEAAPNIMQAVAKYMDEPIGKMRELASDGMITADIVKNAMFAVADETEARFKQIPHTWADVWEISVNKAIKASQPLLEAINIIANHWSILEPIVLSVAGAIGLYAGAVAASSVATWMGGLANAAYAVAAYRQIEALAMLEVALIGKISAQTMDAAVLATATAAQYGFNAALLSNPITWVVVLIIGMIAWFYKWIQSVGGVRIAWMILKNDVLNAIDGIHLGVLSSTYGILDALGMMNVKGTQIFASFVNNAIDHINKLIRISNSVFDTSFEIIQHVTWAAEAKAKEDAYKKERWGNFDEIKRKADIGRLQRQDLIAAAQRQAKKVDGSSSLPNYINMDDLIKNVEDTAGNTGRIADSMEISQEELRYLRDIAERDAINRFTTAEIKVDFKNEATIKSDMDIDGVMNKFTEKFREAIYTEAEGVHMLV